MRVLDKKIQKVLGMKTTQSDIQEALDSFAEYYDTAENTVDSRKNLRYSLEGISCDLTKKFASELSKFYSVWVLVLFLTTQVFQKFSTSLDEVNEMCTEIRTTIDETEKQTRSLHSFHKDTKAYE